MELNSKTIGGRIDELFDEKVHYTFSRINEGERCVICRHIAFPLNKSNNKSTENKTTWREKESLRSDIRCPVRSSVAIGRPEDARGEHQGRFQPPEKIRELNKILLSIATHSLP